MKQILVILFIGFNCLFYTQAQELKCTVTVSHKSISGSNNQVYNTLQGAIANFMNSQKWTNLSISNNERIECNIFLNITDKVDNTFNAELQIQSRRPVYNSSYNTTLLNYKDNAVQFDYKEFAPLIYNENSIGSNLVAVLSFYAYYIIALDQDSYILNGGDDYYRKADQIVSFAQNSSYTGWKPTDNNKNRNRYWMVKQALHADFIPYRNFIYTYNIQGLDVMANSPEMGRSVILNALPLLEDTNSKQPSSMLLEMFFSAKHEELVSLFSKGSDDDRKKAANLLKKLDPYRTSEYNTIYK